MRKLIIYLISIFAILLVSIYVFIPAELKVTKIEYIASNMDGSFRSLSDENTWADWWPKEDSVKNNSEEKIFLYNGYSYRLSNKFRNAIQVFIKKGNDSVESKMEMIKINLDSTILIWKCQMPAGFNPVTKIANYRRAIKIKKNMIQILSNLHSYLQNEENIYGVNFHRIKSKDSTMVAIKNISVSRPSTNDVYNLIEDLKKYISQKGAKENNFPMLHIEQLSDSVFETMVAIPIDRRLEGNGKIFFSRFVPWYVLTAEVRGGDRTVDKALRQMKLYISDFEKTAMALPFESLVTNRIAEPDTLKWITNIYTPIPQ